jgi:hypothetical protein
MRTYTIAMIHPHCLDLHTHKCTDRSSSSTGHASVSNDKQSRRMRRLKYGLQRLNIRGKQPRIRHHKVILYLKIQRLKNPRIKGVSVFNPRNSGYKIRWYKSTNADTCILRSKILESNTSAFSSPNSESKAVAAGERMLFPPA